jgi:hypothetical protein
VQGVRAGSDARCECLRGRGLGVGLVGEGVGDAELGDDGAARGHHLALINAVLHVIRLEEERDSAGGFGQAAGSRLC